MVTENPLLKALFLMGIISAGQSVCSKWSTLSWNRHSEVFLNNSLWPRADIALSGFSGFIRVHDQSPIGVPGGMAEERTDNDDAEEKGKQADHAQNGDQA